MERPTRTDRLMGSPALFGAASALLFFLAAAAWSLSSPPMGSPDEPAQVIKAAAVAHGQLRGTDVVSRTNDPTEMNRVDTSVRVPRSYAELPALNGCYIFQPAVPAGCAPDPGTATEIVSGSTYVGTYPPLYYALVGWPSQFLDARDGIWVMRLASGAVSAALIGLALAAARRTDGGGIVVAGVLVAVTPMVVYMASVVNASGMEITAAIALWCTALAVVRPADATTRADVIRLAIAFCALCGTRSLSPLLAIGVVAGVALMAGRRVDLGRIRRAPAAAPAAVVAAVAFTVSALFVLWSRAYDSLAGAPMPGLTLSDALHTSVTLAPWRIRQMVGYFAYLEAPPPKSLLVVWGVLGGVAVLGALALGTWRQRLVLVALMVAAFAFTVVPEAISAHRFGYIWQGRYTLPVAVGIPILSGWIIGRSSRWRPRAVVPATVVVGLVWVAGQALGQAATLRRHIVGTGQGQGLFSWLSGDGWAPPLPPVVLLVALVVGGLAFVGWVALAARAAPSDRTDRAGQPVAASAPGGPPPVR